jgi:hypothetical protein
MDEIYSDIYFYNDGFYCALLVCLHNCSQKLIKKKFLESLLLCKIEMMTVKDF